MKKLLILIVFNLGISPANEGAAWARNTLRELGEDQGIWMPVMVDDPNIRAHHFVPNTKSAFSIYPNPASDYVYISLPDISESQIEFVLRDGSGKQLMSTSISQKDSRIELPELPVGAYTYFVLFNDEPKYVGELIIK